MEQVSVFLDTDIGCDCDDAGAMAVLHYYEKMGKASIAGMTHCTSSPYSAGCMDAINRYYGRGDIPVGTLKEKGFLEEDNYYKYCRELCASYENAFPDGGAEDAVSVYRRVLAHADHRIKVVAIGPLRNLALFLKSQPDEFSDKTGLELTKEKVSELVVMGGYFPEKNGREIITHGNKMTAEYNIICDIHAAQYISENWPTPIVYSGFEIGYTILTGQKMLDECTNVNPVRRAYELHCNRSRNSWDQTAIVYAVEGCGERWTLSPAGSVVFDDKARSIWKQSDEKNHRYLLQKEPPEETEKKIEAMMCYYFGTK